jgi:soluble lytic murein transglycosylase-like protein
MVLLAAGLQAGERVVLTTGFEMHADRHEIDGDTVRLYDGGGVSELPASLVAEYRAEEYTAPAAAVPAPSAVSSERPAATPAAKLSDPKEMIRETVRKHNLPPQLVALVESVVKQESGFHVDAVSPKGAIGLMQLMPGTARELGVDPHDPAQNIDAGTMYLTSLLEKYEKGDDQVVRALAAYNAGPAAVDKYNGVPPYRETQDYVRRVVRNYLNEQKSGASEPSRVEGSGPSAGSAQ